MPTLGWFCILFPLYINHVLLWKIIIILTLQVNKKYRQTFWYILYYIAPYNIGICFKDCNYYYEISDHGNVKILSINFRNPKYSARVITCKCDKTYHFAHLYNTVQRGLNLIYLHFGKQFSTLRTWHPQYTYVSAAGQQYLHAYNTAA